MSNKKGELKSSPSEFHTAPVYGYVDAFNVLLVQFQRYRYFFSGDMKIHFKWNNTPLLFFICVLLIFTRPEIPACIIILVDTILKCHKISGKFVKNM
jgi:hypothetical protein